MKKRTCLLILFIPLLLASSSTVLASFLTEWGEFQNDETNTGFVHDGQTAHFSEGVDLKLITAFGTASYQPLMHSLGTSNKYLIVVEGNFLRIFDSSLNLVDETSNTFSTPLTITNTSGIGSSKLILTANTTSVLAYQFDGSLITLNTSSVLPGGRNITGGGIKCRTDNTSACYFLDSHDNVCEWGIGVGVTCGIGANSSGQNTQVRYPAIADIDRDGSPEFVSMYGSTLTDMLVYDIISDNLDVGFSGDGLLTLPTCGTSNVEYGSNPVIVNLDGAGDKEIMIGQSGGSGGTSFICMNAYRSDGSSYPNYPVSASIGHANAIDWTRPSSTASCDLGHSREDFCMFARHFKTTAGNAPITDFYACFNENGTKTVQIDTNYLDFGNLDKDVSGLVCADMDTDGIDEIVGAREILYQNGTSLANYSTNSLSQVVVSDMNLDNELEIGLSWATESRIIYSSFTNVPPTLNNSLGFGGYFGYFNPVCVNTTITFEAQEVGGAITGNYVNDGTTDTERLVTNCGQDDTGVPNGDPTTFLNNGSFDASNPTFDCYYNITSTYLVRLFLQDEFNILDFGQFNTQTIALTVIDGNPGITCNIPISFISTPGDQVSLPSDPTGVDASIDATLGIVFGTSSKLKLMVGVGIVISIAMSGAAMAGGIGFAGAALFSLILVVFLGLIPSWIMILMLVGSIMLLIYSKTIFQSGNG